MTSACFELARGAWSDALAPRAARLLPSLRECFFGAASSASASTGSTPSTFKAPCVIFNPTGRSSSSVRQVA